MNQLEVKPKPNRPKSPQSTSQVGKVSFDNTKLLLSKPDDNSLKVSRSPKELAKVTN